MMWKKWIRAAAIRALKTFCQVFASGITVGMLFSEVDWISLASMAGVAAIYSLVTSAAGLPEVSGVGSDEIPVNESSNNEPEDNGDEKV